jgi:hypothetical protein
MIKNNKRIEVRIKEWSTHWAVKIFDQGIDSQGNDRPRSQHCIESIISQQDHERRRI